MASAPAASPAPEPSDASKRRATWAGLMLEGQAELREGLSVSEESFLRVAGPSHRDARGYFIYAVLDELLKTAAVMFRWMEVLEEQESSETPSERFWLASVAEEQSLRIRKLVEVLIDLVCFRATNEDAYYRHLLLLRDLNDVRGTQQDLLEFYGCPSLNVAGQVQRLATEVAELEASEAVSLADAWYAQHGNPPRAAEKLATVGPGRYLSSTRRRLQVALPNTHAPERLALGVSYDRLFSRVSRDVHFTPSSEPRPLDPAALSLNFDEAGILGLNVLLAAKELLGVSGGPRCEQVQRIFDTNSYPEELATAVTRGSAAVGDFVLAYGSLSEVTEVVESDYGYVSYRVLFLTGDSTPDVPEDWFPAQNVRVLLSRSGLLARVGGLVGEGQLSDADEAVMNGDRGRDAFRESVVSAWDAGLRDVVMRQPPGA